MDKNTIILSEGSKKDLAAQVAAEFEYSKEFMQGRIEEWLRRLKLYNNQKRDKDAIGDPLLFSIMHTLVAGFYADEIYVKWAAREAGDVPTSINMNALSSFDYEAMGKAQLDADWLWDAFFFAYGVVDLSYFDAEEKLPIPSIVDPLTWLYDPRATKSDGSDLRFAGSEYYITKRELEENGVNTKEIKREMDQNDTVNQAVQARSEAQGTNNVTWREGDFGDNTLYKGLEWRTWFKGQRVKVKMINNNQEVFKVKELDNDAAGFNYIIKQPFPQAHTFQGTSVGDLVEDKQRARSILLNLVLKIVQSDLYPRYVYNSTVIKNKADLTKFGFNQYIGIPSNNPAQEIQPMNKANPNVYLINNLLSTLDMASQKATGTPDMQQGVLSSQERSVGELNITKQSADTRYALVAKSLMRGEKDFWKQYYKLYKKNYKKGLGEKVLRVAGTGVDAFRPITRDNVIAKCKADYDLKIVSSVLQEQENTKKLGKYVQVMNTLPGAKDADVQEAVKIMVDLTGIAPDEATRIFKPTLQERMAKRENEMLNLNRLPEVNPDLDDHELHIRIHGQANQTAATFAHIEAHNKMLLIKLEQANIAMKQQIAAQGLGADAEASAGATVPGAETMMGGAPGMNPSEAARTPLVDSDTMKQYAPNAQKSPTQMAKTRAKLSR